MIEIKTFSDQEIMESKRPIKPGIIKARVKEIELTKSFEKDRLHVKFMADNGKGGSVAIHQWFSMEAYHAEKIRDFLFAIGIEYGNFDPKNAVGKEFKGRLEYNKKNFPGFVAFYPKEYNETIKLDIKETKNETLPHNHKDIPLSDDVPFNDEIPF